MCNDVCTCWQGMCIHTCDSIFTYAIVRSYTQSTRNHMYMIHDKSLMTMMDAKSFAPATCISIQYIAHGARRTDREYIFCEYVCICLGMGGQLGLVHKTLHLIFVFDIWRLVPCTVLGQKNMRRCLYVFLLLTLNLIILYDGNDGSWSVLCYDCGPIVLHLAYLVCLTVCFVLSTYCANCIYMIFDS